MYLDRDEFYKLKNKCSFVMAYTFLIESKDLTDGELRVLLYLANQREDQRRSASYIGSAIGKHRTSVSRILLDLEKKGILQIEREAKKVSKYRLRIMQLNTSEENVSASKTRHVLQQNCTQTVAKTVQNTKQYQKNQTTIVPDESATTVEMAEEKATTTSPSEVLDYWHSKPELPKVRIMSPERKRKLSARLKFPEFVANWKEVIDLIASTPFLLGDSERGWKADFDWLIANNTNFAKVLEGKYGKVKEKIEYIKI